MTAIALIGLLGAVHNQKNFLIAMMGIELMYLGLIGLFFWTSSVLNDAQGLVSGLVFLTIAASESALGLGILVVLFRFSQSISFNSYQELKS